MTIVTGDYVHDRDEDFEDFLLKNGENVLNDLTLYESGKINNDCYKYKGLNYLLRKIAVRTSPCITLTEGDKENEYIISVKTVVKSFEMNITIGEITELEDFLQGSGKKQFIFTHEGNKLIQTPTGENPGINKIIREFVNGGMIITMIHLPSGAQAKRHFKKQ